MLYKSRSAACTALDYAVPGAHGVTSARQMRLRGFTSNRSLLTAHRSRPTQAASFILYRAKSVTPVTLPLLSLPLEFGLASVQTFKYPYPLDPQFLFLSLFLVVSPR